MKDSEFKSGTHLINRKGLRRLLGTGWQGATKEHRRQRSVTEEQRSQRVLSNRPFGLPFFATAASLLIGQRSRVDILPPRASWRHQIPGNASPSYL
jgi:hypothetical protein